MEKKDKKIPSDLIGYYEPGKGIGAMKINGKTIYDGRSYGYPKRFKESKCKCGNKYFYMGLDIGHCVKCIDKMECQKSGKGVESE